MLGVGHIVGRPADGVKHVDGRVMPLLGQLPGQLDVAIEHAPAGVGDRLIHVAAFDQHRVEAGDRAVLRPAGALQQRGQHREHARRITPRRRRLARGQPDLPLGVAEARDRVHDQKRIVAGVAEILGNAGGHHRRTHAQQRRFIAGGADHDRVFQPVFAKRVVDKLAHLAPALADQSNDRHVGGRVLGHRAKQGRFAHPRHRKSADALPPADREHRIHRAYARRQRLFHRLPLKRIQRIGMQRHRHGLADRAFAVHRPAHAVDHPPQQPRADRHRLVLLHGHDAIPPANAGRRRQRHHNHIVLIQADDLALDYRPRATLGMQLHQRADRHRQIGDAHRQTAHLCHRAAQFRRGGAVQHGKLRA